MPDSYVFSLTSFAPYVFYSVPFVISLSASHVQPTSLLKARYRPHHLPCGSSDIDCFPNVPQSISDRTSDHLFLCRTFEILPDVPCVHSDTHMLATELLRTQGTGLHEKRTRNTTRREVRDKDEKGSPRNEQFHHVGKPTIGVFSPLDNSTNFDGTHMLCGTRVMSVRPGSASRSCSYHYDGYVVPSLSITMPDARMLIFVSQA